MSGPDNKGMPKILDLTGQTFGLLTVLHQDGMIAKRKAWRCVCACGTEKTVRSEYLRNGDTTSCGCRLRERQREGSVVHGHNRNNKPSPTYNTWRAMKERCRLPSHPGYKNYGAKGVSVCARWAVNFGAFLEDMGERPAGKTLDRIDPHGNYEPLNCRWATPAEQTKNRRQPENQIVHVIA